MTRGISRLSEDSAKERALKEFQAELWELLQGNRASKLLEGVEEGVSLKGTACPQVHHFQSENLKLLLLPRPGTAENSRASQSLNVRCSHLHTAGTSLLMNADRFNSTPFVHLILCPGLLLSYSVRQHNFPTV